MSPTTERSWSTMTNQSSNGDTCSASGNTNRMIVSTTIALIGSSVPIGYGLGVLNCPQAIIRIWIQEAMYKNYAIKMANHENVMMWSTVISAFLIGCTFGALGGGSLADKVGRRQAFLLNYLLNLISCAIFALCKVYQAVEIILISQLLFGISAGISSSLVPIYLSEIELKSFRGLSVMHAFGISIGVFISQICGMESLLGSAELWPYLMYIHSSGTLIALLLHPYLQESPVFISFIDENIIQSKYLLNTKKCDNALEKAPISSTEFSSSDQSEPEKYTLYKLFKERSLHKPILLTILLYMNTVFSGVNAIITYGNVMLTSAGLNQQQSEIASLCATGLRCSMGIVSIILTKKCRRKPVLLAAIGGCILCLIMLISFLSSHSFLSSYMAIFSCALYFTFYAAGLGGLACTVSAELLPDNPRSLVLSFASGIYWISNLLVGTTFPLIEHSIGAFSLLFFIFYCTVSSIIMYFYLPETFNKETILEDDNNLHDNNLHVKQIDKSNYLLIS